MYVINKDTSNALTRDLGGYHFALLVGETKVCVLAFQLEVQPYSTFYRIAFSLATITIWCGTALTQELVNTKVMQCSPKLMNLMYMGKCGSILLNGMGMYETLELTIRSNVKYRLTIVLLGHQK